MTLHRKLFILSTSCILTPIVLLFVDSTLLNCFAETKHFPKVLGFVDVQASRGVVVIPVGLCILILAFILKKKSQGKSAARIVYESVLIIFLGLVLGSLLLASLNTARSKGPNTDALMTISQMRAAAELYSEKNSNKGYDGFCESEMYLQSSKKLIGTVSEAQGSFCEIPEQITNCFDSSDSYAVSISMFGVSHDRYLCADSGSGFVGGTTKKLIGTQCLH